MPASSQQVLSSDNRNMLTGNQEELFLLTFENAAVGIAHVGRDGNFIRVNRKLAEITGYPKEELMEKTFQEITHPDDLEQDLQQAEALSRGKINSYSMEKRYFRKDGSIVWIKLTGSAVLDPNGEVSVFIAVIEDISEKKKAEEAYSEKQEQLINTLNSITDCYFSIDRKFRFIEMNSVSERLIFNRPASELIGHSFDKLYPAGKGDRFYQEFEKAFKDKVSVHFEAWSHVSGKWLEVHAYPRLQQLDVYFRDISERKNLEESLRRSEQKFSKLFISSPAFSIITDIRNGTFIDVNDAYCRITGYSRDELIGHNSLELGIVSEKTRERLMEEVRENGKLDLIELPLTDRNGEIHTILYSAEITSINGDNFIITSGIDITERKKAEEALRESEQRFKIAAAAARIGSYSRDLQTGKDEWSPEFMSIYGYKPNETLPLKDGLPESVHPDDRESVISEARARFSRQTDPQFNSEHRIILPGGEIRWVNVRGKLDFDENNHPSRTYGIVMDITERKKAEETLRNNEKRKDFLLRLSDMLRPVADPVEIEKIASRTVMEFLNADRCYYCKINDQEISIDHVAIKGDLPSVAGNYSMSDLPVFKKVVDAGRPFVVQDIHSSDLLDESLKKLLKNLKISSFIDVPVIKNGKTAGIFCLTQSTQRNWTDFEVEVVTEIAERTWSAIEQANAEKALRESEGKYRTLFESIDEGFCICEMLIDDQGKPYDYRWLEINPTWEHQTGLKAPIGKTALELVPNLEQHWIDIYGKVAMTGEPVRFQLESKAMGRWFDVYAFRAGEPHLHQFGILFTDITLRKQTEETLRQKVEEIEKLLDILPAAVFIAEDPECQHIWGNRMANEFYETGKDENVSANTTFERRYFKNGKELLPEDLPMQKAARENKQIYNDELDVLFPDGKLLNLQGSAIPLNDEQGNVRGSIGAFVDITGRMEVENALRESEEKFRMLANNISQLAWMADDQGRIFWFNKRWLEYTGTTTEEVQGWGWTKMHHPEHRDRVLEKRKQAWAAGKAWEDTFPLRGKDGNYRWYLSRAVPIRDDQGNITRWFGTNTDITEQRESEKLVQKANELFENLLFIAAHDLKGPIANMYSAFYLMDRLPSEEKLKLIDKFKDIAGQLEKTVSGISNILQVHKSTGTSVETLWFEGILNDIVLEFKDKLHHDSLHYDFAKKYSVRYIEPFLRSIMKNLISNAIKYSRNEVPLEINIATQTAGSYTLLTISDNGSGIDLKKHGDKLFSPFQRFNPYKAKGTGIGLYLIKSIIEKNGGKIAVESTPDQGTTFYCYLREY